MIGRIGNLIIVSVLLVLTACGGGSSSSGASQGGPAPTAFAGTYQGQFTARAQGVSVTENVVITVTPNGRVILDTESEAACVGEPDGTPFLVGDRVRFSGSGSCFIAGVGTCNVVVEGEIRFSATNAIGQGTERIDCPGITVVPSWGIGATKVS